MSDHKLDFRNKIRIKGDRKNFARIYLPICSYTLAEKIQWLKTIQFSILFFSYIWRENNIKMFLQESIKKQKIVKCGQVK